MSDPIPAGWPCALLPAVPPSVADRQSSPTADEILPQILTLAPRGPAWGTDEAGDGTGASPVLRQVWRAVATWVADLNVRDFAVAVQAFPSAAASLLGSWEADLGLPAACGPPPDTIERRVANVRARFGALGGASPAYFVCLAQSLGYAITIEEPTGFLVDVSEVIAGEVAEAWFVCSADGLAGSVIGADGDPLEGYAPPASVTLGDELVGLGAVETWFVLGEDGSELGIDGDPIEGFETRDPDADVWGAWVAHLVDPTLSYFECSADGLAGSVLGTDGDPIEGYTPARDLECELRRLCPPHTALTFSYDPVPLAA